MTRRKRIGGFDPTPQELYDEIFQDEDLVVLIDVEDRFDFGVLYTHPDGIELWNPRLKSRHYRFDQVRFLAHDGVPLRKLRGYTEPDECLVARLDRARDAEGRLYGLRLAREGKGGQIRFGDPWELDAALPRLYQHPDWRETCVIFGNAIERYNGGNAGLLWDLGSILEVAT